MQPYWMALKNGWLVSVHITASELDLCLVFHCFGPVFTEYFFKLYPFSFSVEKARKDKRFMPRLWLGHNKTFTVFLVLSLFYKSFRGGSFTLDRCTAQQTKSLCLGFHTACHYTCLVLILNATL